MDPIFVPVAELGQLSNGELTPVEMAGRRLLATISADGCRVFGRECPHEGADLIEADVVDGTVSCPNHNYIFDLDSGECMVPGGCPPLIVLDAEVRDGTVYVKLDLGGA